MTSPTWCIVLAGGPAQAQQALAMHLAPILAQAHWAPPLHLALSPDQLAPHWPQPWVLLMGAGDQGAALPTWREALHQRQWSYQVLYGQGSDLIAQATHALARDARLKGLSGLTARPEQAPRWRGPCERCADPGCEHRLFSQLQIG